MTYLRIVIPTDDLGGAVAGLPIAIRFVDNRKFN
jgi:hypothetical protein